MTDRRTAKEWRIRNTKKFLKDNADEFKAMGLALLFALSMYGLIILFYGLGLWSY